MVDYERLLHLALEGDPDVLAQLRSEATRRGDLRGQALALACIDSPDGLTWEALCALLDDATAAPSAQLLDALDAHLDARWPPALRACEAADTRPSCALARAVILRASISRPLLSVLPTLPPQLQRRHTLILEGFASVDDLDPCAALLNPQGSEPLRGLRWRQHRLDDDGLRALLERPFTAALTHLDLSGSAISDDVIPALIRALPGLREVALRETSVGMRSAQRLVEGLPELRRLDVRDTHVDPAMARALNELERFSTMLLDEASAWCVERAQARDIDAIAGLFAVREDIARAPVLHKHLWPELRGGPLIRLYLEPEPPSAAYEAILSHIPIAADLCCELLTEPNAPLPVRLMATRVLGELRPARGPEVLARALASDDAPLVASAREALERYDDAHPTPVGARGVQIVPCSQSWEAMEPVSEAVRHCASCDMPVVRVHDLERLRELAGERCAYFSPRPTQDALTIRAGMTMHPLEADEAPTLLGADPEAPLQDLRLASRHAQLSLRAGAVLVRALEGRVEVEGVSVRERWLTDAGDVATLGPVTLRYQPAQGVLECEGFRDARSPSHFGDMVIQPLPGIAMPPRPPLGGAPLPPLEYEKPSLWKRLKRFFGGS